MRISDWSSDVCSSDLHRRADIVVPTRPHFGELRGRVLKVPHLGLDVRARDWLAIERAAALAILRLQVGRDHVELGRSARRRRRGQHDAVAQDVELALRIGAEPRDIHIFRGFQRIFRSEEHTSELQSLMRTSYAVFCLKKKKTK